MKKQRSRRTIPTRGCRSESGKFDHNSTSKFKGNVDEDSELMRKAMNGDIEAFNCIYKRYCPILRVFLASYKSHHISPDDFIQEIFTRLWQGRGSFRGESLFMTYMLGIAQHTMNEKIRQSRKIVKIKDLKQVTRLAKDFNGNGMSQPEAEFYLNELHTVLERIRALLTAEQRQALEASQADDVSLSEASQKLGCSYGAFRSHLKRARKRSAELLARILDNE